jgi:hypothetical protein
MPVILATQDTESGGSWFKASLGNSLQEPISKISITKKAGGVAQGEGPEFKPQYNIKKKSLTGFNSKLGMT